MPSCLSGGSRTYQFDREISSSLLCNIPKTPSSSNRSQSSSSSSFSETGNSPIAISTKKPRTPRKRPNQIYTEAAVLLSTIYPNIFPTKNLKTLGNKHPKPFESFAASADELLPPFPAIAAGAGFLLHRAVPENPTIRIEPRLANSSGRDPAGPGNNLRQSFQAGEIEDGFDTESFLGEEISGEQQGIDSIIGSSNSSGKDYDSSHDDHSNEQNGGGFYHGDLNFVGYYGKPRFEFEFGGRCRALRHVDDGDWCRFPTVDILEIIPRLKVSVKEEEEKFRQGLCLKLNYDEVLTAWSDRGSPFSDEFSATDSPESSTDAIARLTQYDLLSEIGNWSQQMDESGVREASVLRYREKRKTRMFSKKIRYQVRKANADRRPRMKGRFVRRPALLPRVA